MKDNLNPSSVEVGDIVSRKQALTHAEVVKYGKSAQYLHYYKVEEVSYYKAALRQFITGDILIEPIGFIEDYYDNHGKSEIQFILYG